jgi:hypothetical protein
MHDTRIESLEATRATFAPIHTYESAELFAECNCLDSSLISQSEEIDDEYLMDEITLPWTSDDVSGTAQKWRSEVATRNYFRLMAGVEALKNIDLSKLKLPER